MLGFFKILPSNSNKNMVFYAQKFQKLNSYKSPNERVFLDTECIKNKWGLLEFIQYLTFLILFNTLIFINFSVRMSLNKIVVLLEFPALLTLGKGKNILSNSKKAIKSS